MNIIIRITAVILTVFGILFGTNFNFLPEDNHSIDLKDFTYNQDLELDGQSIFVGPKLPNVSWIVDIGGWGTEAVYGDDGTVYLGRLNVRSNKFGHIIALNPDGSKKWAFNITEKPDPSCNLVPENLTEEFEIRCKAIESDIVSLARSKDGMIFAGLALHETGNISKPRNTSQSRFIVAINLDGTEEWRFDLGHEDVTSRILIGDNGAMYFVSGNKNDLKNIYSLNSRDGSVLWKKEYESQNINGPSIGKGGILYFGGDKVRAIDSVFGTPIWEYDTKTPAAFPFGPAVGPDGTIYVTSISDFNLHAINPDGSLKWKKKIGFGELIPAVGPDGTIYVHTWENVLKLANNNPDIGPGLHAINQNDGSIKWSRDGFFKLTENELNDEDIKRRGQKFGGSDSSIIIDKDGILYFGSDIGRIYAVNSKNGNTLWEARFRGEFDNRPIITPDGTLVLCHHGGGGLYEGPRCIGINDNGKLSPTPGVISENSEDNTEDMNCLDVCVDIYGGTSDQCLLQCKKDPNNPNPNSGNGSGVVSTSKCVLSCLDTGESNAECNQACNAGGESNLY